MFRSSVSGPERERKFVQCYLLSNAGDEAKTWVDEEELGAGASRLGSHVRVDEKDYYAIELSFPVRASSSPACLPLRFSSSHRLSPHTHFPCTIYHSRVSWWVTAF